MCAHGACDVLFITCLDKMIAPLESIPDLQSFGQQRRRVMESQNLELDTCKLVFCFRKDDQFKTYRLTYLDGFSGNHQLTPVN